MDELRTEYTVLFNGITETIKGLEGMIHRLELLQQAAENSYLDSFETSLAEDSKAARIVTLEPETMRARE